MDKIRPLIQSTKFPLSQLAVDAYNLLKREISEAIVEAIDKNAMFVIETNASEYCITATLNQSSCPVAFFSWTLSKSEQRHSSIEKEACAIVESLKK